jgi:hypothetical protein
MNAPRMMTVSPGEGSARDGARTERGGPAEARAAREQRTPLKRTKPALTFPLFFPHPLAPYSPALNGRLPLVGGSAGEPVGGLCSQPVRGRLRRALPPEGGSAANELPLGTLPQRDKGAELRGPCPGARLCGRGKGFASLCSTPYRNSAF